MGWHYTDWYKDSKDVVVFFFFAINIVRCEISLLDETASGSTYRYIKKGKKYEKETKNKLNGILYV